MRFGLQICATKVSQEISTFLSPLTQLLLDQVYNVLLQQQNFFL